MRANDKAVQIIHQPGVTRLGARNGEIRSSTPIDSPQLFNLFPAQTLERRVVQHTEEILESLPCAFTLVDELIGRHELDYSKGWRRKVGEIGGQGDGETWR